MEYSRGIFLSLITLALSGIVVSGLVSFLDVESSKAQPSQHSPFKPEVIEAHLNFLADDLLEGRETGTRGYELAAKYVETQFKAMGLEPAGNNGTYFQSVPLQKSTLVPDSVTFSIAGPEGTRSFQNGHDLIIRSSQLETDQAVKGEVVFAGFGIVAPDLDNNDYEGLDVKGKIVAVFSGAPKSFPSELRAHYGSGTEKEKTAASHGAIGIISLYTPTREQILPFERALGFTNLPRMTWVGPDLKPYDPAPEIRFWATLGTDAATALFAGTGQDFAALQRQAEDEKTPPKGFPLKVSVNMTRKSTHEVISSPNVAALLPGSDPELADEVVVISSHLDHIGIGKPVDGDAIYNGALDNASGVAIMLEVARVFSQAPEKPKRSILFLAVTAEEKGLIGADYYANNPTVPMENIIANVNLDGVLMVYDFVDVIAFGAEHSTIGNDITSAAGEMGIVVTPDPMPEQGIFTRSDHYAFVKKGVPAVFMLAGFGETADGTVGAEVFEKYLKNYYHKPSDDLKLPLNYEIGAKFPQTVLYFDRVKQGGHVFVQI